MKLFRKHNLTESVNYANTVILEDTTRWIIGSRNNWLLAVGVNKLEVSFDNGVTYPNSIVFNDANLVTSGYIYQNGNMMVITKNNKIYLTNYNLDSVVEKPMLNTDGLSVYPIHTPVNSLYPGAYFNVTDPMDSNNNTDLHVWINYTNAHSLGASPINIYETRDFGETYKISYKFGQNLNYRDDGSPNGSTVGRLFGDPSNSIVTRHGHYCGYNVNNNKWYANTGDANTVFNSMDEIHWFEGVDDGSNITWTKLDFGAPIERTSRMKGAGFFFVNDYIYWCSDANPVPDDKEQGLWRSKLSTFTNLSTHEKVISVATNETLLGVKVDWNTNIILMIVVDNLNSYLNKLIGAKDFGHGEKQTKTFDSNTYKFLRMTSPNAFGFFRLDTKFEEANQGRSFLIKIGEDLFANV